MFTLSELPNAYRPYKRIQICSNIIEGGGVLAVIGDVPPILIGGGESPMIWIQAPTDPEGKNYVELMKASVPFHKAISVVSDVGALTVFASGVKILYIVYSDLDSASVEYLDLAPIGLNIHGDLEGLYVGGVTFSTNTFSGVEALVSLG